MELTKYYASSIQNLEDTESKCPASDRQKQFDTKGQAWDLTATFPYTISLDVPDWL